MDSKPMVSLPKLDTKEVDNSSSNLNGKSPMGIGGSSSQTFENAGQRRVSVTRGIHAAGVPNSAKVNRINGANRGLQVSTNNGVRISDQLSQSKRFAASARSSTWQLNSTSAGAPAAAKAEPSRLAPVALAKALSRPATSGWAVERTKSTSW